MLSFRFRVRTIMMVVALLATTIALVRIVAGRVEITFHESVPSIRIFVPDEPREEPFPPTCNFPRLKHIYEIPPRSIVFLALASIAIPFCAARSVASIIRQRRSLTARSLPKANPKEAGRESVG